ncbi:MAG: hypothetical protein LBU38_04920, partial [Propionibacteriaceae bacterium]|nr:hypothetical protein [Propionibacteriaceae bacterium]
MGNNDIIRLAGESAAIEIAPLGATLYRFEVKVGDSWRSIVLSRPDKDTTVNTYLSATVGRYANRIGRAAFELDGTRYRLDANEPPNTLHGGSGGISEVIWDVVSATDTEVVLRHISPDGDQGFPGTLHIQAAFKLLPGGAQVTYCATTDAPTVVNLTAHPYFNLAGQGTVDDHLLQVN